MVGSTAILQATCVDATIIPFLENRLNLSYGCYGCRDATDIRASETVLGFPASDLSAIVLHLEYLGEKAIANSRSKKAFSMLNKSEHKDGEGPQSELFHDGKYEKEQGRIMNEREEKIMEQKIIIYGTKTCPFCIQAREAYGDRAVFVDVDEDPESLNKMLSLSGGKRQVPVIVEGDQGDDRICRRGFASRRHTLIWRDLIRMRCLS
ncbi:MAG: DUF169 domain-containing protein [Desulfobacterales bacterium]|nr:DUF169 domain-containing protein [Desulfobacterales bacterium]